MVIEPGRIINDFIEPNKRQYAIPVYQRNYEWSKEQCIKLFNDIVQAYKKDKSHFCGSVVYALMKEEHNIHYYIIIDGQQRLTTIYILLKALLDHADTESAKALIEEALFNVDKFDTYDVDTASKLKLKPIKTDNQQLALLMDKKYSEIDKSCGIWHNYELFSELIKKETSHGLTVKEIYKGLEKLTCARIKLDADDNAQEIFERINSTGVPLTLADKIRNFVLMTDANQEKLYENYWLKSEQLIGRNHMTAFFLDYLNIKIDGFAKESDAYDIFKEVFYDNKYTNATMLEEILHYAKFYHAFLYGDKTYSDEINNSLISLQKLNQTTIFLFLFRVFDDYENDILSQAELEKVLGFLLNYSIRRLICEIGSNSLRGLYKTLYSRVFARSENKQHYYDSIVSFFQQLTSKDALPDDNSFILALKQNNLYRKNALCKYLLVSIENEGKEQLVTTNLTIEHVLPQTKNLSTAWQQMLGENWQADRDRYLHTLGNLTLTGYNSELGDKPFAEKKELLSEVHTKVVKLYETIKCCDEWNAATIEARADVLSKKVAELYAVESPQVVVDFSDPRYKEYSCTNPDDATYKTPNYYILQGERVSVNNYAEMLRSVVSRLYAIDSTIIENMARNDEQPVSWSQNVMFSYDSTKTTGDYQIKGTSIYESVGFSAYHIMCIIHALLIKYDIEATEFVYSARSNRSVDESTSGGSNE